MVSLGWGETDQLDPAESSSQEGRMVADECEPGPEDPVRALKTRNIARGIGIHARTGCAAEASTS